MTIARMTPERETASPRAKRSRRLPRTTRQRAIRPTLETIESRLLLTTYFVGNVGNSGEGTLRQAILDSNANTTQVNVIDFAITLGSPSIAPTTPLPTITQSVVIDGTSQSGYVGTPIVELVGSANVPIGLNFTAGGSTIKGLVLNRFSDAAIVLGGSAGGSTVAGDYIGTNVAGTATLSNWDGRPRDLSEQ